MDDQPSLAVVFAADARFLLPLAIALRSLVDCNRWSWPIRCFVLADRFPLPARLEVERSLPSGAAEIEWLPVDLRMFAQVAREQFPESVNARLLAPSILPESVTRFIYLDADLIVQDSLESLWRTNLGDAVVGAVPDRIDQELQGSASTPSALPKVARYFNSGVLLVDVPRWRELEVSEKALEYLRENPHTPFPDQDALNAVCDGRWYVLDGRWNYQGHLTRERDVCTTRGVPAVVHFVTAEKPWRIGSMSRYKKEFDEVRRRTEMRRGLCRAAVEVQMDRIAIAVRRLWASDPIRRIRRVSSVVVGRR